MPLTLSDQDLAELQTLMDDTLMRPKDAVRLVGFFQSRQVRAAQEAAVRAETAKVAEAQQKIEPNGHDANPYAERSTAAH